MLCNPPSFSPSQMAFSNNLFHLLLTLSFLLHFKLSESGTIGVNYGRIADNLPSPPQVVQLLQSQGLTRAKIFDSESTVLSALAGSNISVTVAIPNENLSAAASSQSFTDTWVQSNILPYYTNSLKIETITVGNEVFVDPKNRTPFLVPAMKNVYLSLVKFNLSSIKISSPIALSALQTSYPSSSGSFKAELIEPFIKPMLAFLRQTGSYIMVNVYPFFAYSANSGTISLDYALFRGSSVTDPNNGLVYNSLFEAQIDAVYAAMNALSFNDVKMVVSETGWPSIGDANEVGAGKDNAAAYNGNLVKRVLTGSGTPLRPTEPMNVYLFALFNEDLKPGPTSEKNYGLFYPNEQKVYDIPLKRDDLLNDGDKSRFAPAPTNGGDGKVGQTWCVARVDVEEGKLEAAIEFACSDGGADCRPIQPGGTCHNPNTLVAHASYAFNSYYQKNYRRKGTCYFGGAASVVTQPPVYGSCVFPAGN